MNVSHRWLNFERVSPEIVKFGSILVLGVGVGILSSSYPPLLCVVGTGIFTVICIILYASSYFLHIHPVEELSGSIPAKSGLLFYLCYVAFFLSITIPKSGKTVAGIPITTANIAILIALLGWVLKILSFRSTGTHFPLLKFFITLIAYGIIAFLIGFVNHNPYKFVILDFVAFIGFIPVYFLVCSAVQTKSHIRKIIIALVLSSIIVCAYGMLQKRIGFERVVIPGITEQHGLIMYEGVGRWNVIEGGERKVYSTFQNGNIFGNHLATFIPFLGGMLLGIRTFRNRMFLLGLFLFAWYILILTYSRGALVGAVSGMLVLGIIAKKIRFKAFLAIIFIFLIFFIFLYYYSDHPELVRYDFRRIATEPERFSAGRFERAREVIQGFYNLPITSQLFGLGFGGILISPRGWIFNHVDNLYLTLLFKMGIVGFLMLCSLLVYSFVILLRLRSNCQDLPTQALINGGIAGLAASLIHNFADTLWFFPPLSANFWFLMGITVMIGVIGTQESQANASDLELEKTRTVKPNA